MKNNKVGRALVSNHGNLQAPQQSEWNWGLWRVTIPTLTIAIFSTTLSVGVLCKLVELSAAVNELKLEYSRLHTPEQPFVHKHGDVDGPGESISGSKIIEFDEPRYGEFSTYGRQGARGDVSGDGTLLRERRTVSALDTDKNKRKKVSSRKPTSHKKKNKKKDKKKHTECCEIQLNSHNHGKITFQKHKCLDALEAYIKDTVDERRYNVPIHLVSNVTLTNEDFELVNQDRTRSIQLSHGRMDYNGYTPKSETLQFWTIPDWIHMDKGPGDTYDLLPVDTMVTAVKVKVPGVYFINAQVTFHTTRGHLGYHVKKILANQRAATSETLMTCLNGIDYVARGNPVPEKYRSCATNGMQYLKVGEQVYIEVIDPNLFVVTRPEWTFWGLIRVY